MACSDFSVRSQFVAFAFCCLSIRLRAVPVAVPARSAAQVKEGYSKHSCVCKEGLQSVFYCRGQEISTKSDFGQAE